MPLSGVRLDAITEDHLQGLIDNGVSEGRRIDYKIAVGGRDEDKREFMADVSSFANAAGGDLLIGVDEVGGVASALDGIAKKQAEAEILRLENLIRDGLDPRIPGVAIRAVDLPDPSKVVLVLRVPRSWAAPHMVTFRSHSRFYSRNSAGKYPLDVGEIRSAFVASETARTQLRSFRLERLGRLTANDGPIRLTDNPKTVLHVVPLTAVDPSAQYDVSRIADPTNLRPMLGSAWNNRINFDGALAWAPASREDQTAWSYTQVFRTGVIEGVETRLLRRDRSEGIPSVDFERYLIDALGRYLALAELLEAPPPYLVALSLLDVRGLRMGVGYRYDSGDEHTAIDRDDLVIPEALVVDATAEPHTVLRALQRRLIARASANTESLLLDGYSGSPELNAAFR